MPDEVRLWQVGTDNHLSELPRTALDLEKRLQDWLVADIVILDPGLLVIGQEVETDFRGYIDLLCMDEEGDLVVVELKRDKTPREITAQALDYGSWVADLSHERVTTIAEGYLKEKGFSQAFRDRFGADVPETLNGSHRMLIVAAQIDESTERIVKYLSDKHGVNINVATFQYFSGPDGGGFLARVFLIEPTTVQLHSRTKGTSKRSPNLTYDELSDLAESSGVQALYQHAVSSFGEYLQKHTTQSSIGFAALFENSRNTVISLIPGESGQAKGLRFQLYKYRFGTLVGKNEDEVDALMPAAREAWSYVANAGPHYEGYQGYIHSRDEIDRLAIALSSDS